MRVLSLFSGGGLGDYGLELAGMEIVGQFEIDEYCQKILALRWPDVPKWRDVKAVHLSHTHSERLEWKRPVGDPQGRQDARGSAGLRDRASCHHCENCITVGRIDLVSGGFPCQDISTAGKGAGITGARSGLWKEMLRIICTIRPRYVLVENVTALLGRGLGVVLGDLAEIGYDTEWDCIPASAIGAPHQRDRIWIVAYASGFGAMRRPGEVQQTNGRPGQSLLRKSISASQIQSANAGILSAKPSRERCGRFWFVEPNVGRVAHGVAKRVDRLKLLGNGQVVQVVEWIGKQIMRYDNEKKLRRTR